MKSNRIKIIFLLSICLLCSNIILSQKEQKKEGIYTPTDSVEISQISYSQYKEILDNLHDIKKKELPQISEAKIQLIKEIYKTELLTRDNEILKYKKKTENWYLIALSISLFSLILLVVSITLYKKHTSNTRFVNRLRKNEKKILKTHLKNREEEFLTTMIFVNERLSKLYTIKQQLSTAVKYKNTPEIENAIIRLEKFISSTSDLGVLKDRIESKYPGITSTINIAYPDLSLTDIRHCLLINLNMSIAESAQLLNVSPKVVEIGRNRIKKKINIPEHISLKDHLQAVID